MLKTKLGLLLLLLGISFPSFARERLFGYCEDGGSQVVTLTNPSTTLVQQSFPSCTVTVYQTGTVTLATLFADNFSTPLANPFTAAPDGFWFFYPDNGTYDVQFSGGGISVPFTRGGQTAFDISLYIPPTPPGQACGPSGQVQYSSGGGVFGCDANIIWSKAGQQLTITGTLNAVAVLNIPTGNVTAAGGFISNSPLGSSIGFVSNKDGAALRGYQVLQNVAVTNGGYFQFSPVTYNPYDGGSCLDANGNSVQQPLPLPGGAFGANDAILWVGTSPQMPPGGSCGAPLPINTNYGLNTNVYVFARGGLATDNGRYNAINTIYLSGGNPAGGVTAGALIAGTLYPTGTVTTTGTLGAPAYLGGYIQVGHSTTVPAVGTISTVTNPLVAGDGLIQGTLFWNDNLGCLYGYNGSAWNCIGGGAGGGTVNNCATQFAVAYYAAIGTAVQCNAAFLWNPATPQVSLAGNFQTNGTTFGFNASTCNLTNCIQVSNGGLSGKWSTVSDSTFWLEETAPAISASGQAKIYADSTAHRLLYSENAGSFVTIATTAGALTIGHCIQVGASGVDLADSGGTCGGGGGSGTVTNCTTQYGVAFYATTGTTVSCNPNFTFNSTSRLVTVTSSASTNPAILASVGFIQSDAGFLATGSTCLLYNCIQAPGGGVGNVKNVTALNYIQTGTSSGPPPLTSGDAFHGGATYWDTSTSPGSSFKYTGACWFPYAGVQWTVIDTACHPLITGASLIGTQVITIDSAVATGGIALSANTSGSQIQVYNASGSAVVDTLGSSGLSVVGSNVQVASTANFAGYASAFSNNNAGGQGTLITCSNGSHVACADFFGNGSSAPSFSLSGVVSFEEGSGAPSGTCSYTRCIYINTSGGTGTTGYVFFGGAWHAAF